MEAFAYGFSFATTIGTHVSIGSLPIVYYGNDYQKEKYLPKIATAEIKTAYALTEPLQDQMLILVGLKQL